MKTSKNLQILAGVVATGATVKSAAETIGISASAAYQISCTAEFRIEVARLRTEIVTAAVGKLSDGAAEAVDTLRSLLTEDNEPAIRLNASKAILAALPTMSEFGELRKRIDEIESTPTSLKVAR